MKTKSILIILISMLFFGCEKDDIDNFGEKHYLRFDLKTKQKEYNTMSFSFAFLTKKTKEYTLRIPVEIKGRMLTENFKYHIGINAKKTTLPNECYAINKEYEFKKGKQNKDTLTVKLFRKEILKKGVKTLCLKIIPSKEYDVFRVDNKDCSEYIILVSDIMSKPQWWDSIVTDVYLGKYSAEKYSAFVEVTGVSDFGNLTPTEKRYYAIKFKRDLEKNIRFEKDGSRMTVSITG